jgi:hypothetical protein
MFPKHFDTPEFSFLGLLMAPTLPGVPRRK